jgi:hypothetical protein
MAIQHLTSSTANKRPAPAAMSNAQLAINSNTSSPGLFFKDSAGALIKVGPVHVGSTAPNASPASGGETGNTVGEQWLDTTGGTYVFKVWDGSAWRSETGTFVDVNGDVMTGALGIIAGSAGSPGLYFSGDTNTGLYSPGADQVAISTGGTGRLFVDASGRLGVGTASPSTNLHLGGSADQSIQINGNGTAAYVGTSTAVAQISSNRNPTTGAIYDSGRAVSYINLEASDGNANIQFYTTATNNVNATERLRITSAGLVGVGTSSPQSVVDISSGVRGVPETSGSTTSVTTLRVRGASNGVLDIGELSSATAGSYWVQVRDRTDLGFEYNLSLQPNGGNVGVGTTNPGAKLDVTGGTTQAGLFTITGNNNPSGTGIIASFGAGGGGDPATTKGGFISVGGSSVGDCELGIAGSYPGIIKLRTNYTTPRDLLTIDPVGSMVFLPAGTERARIDSSGRLLVGTSSSSGTNTLFEVSSTAANSANVALVKRDSGTADQAGQQLHFYNFGPAGTARAADTEVGSMRFYGSQPTSGAAQEMARITCAADLLQTGSNTSGRLVFSTTADGASSPTERMRISQNGIVTIKSATDDILIGGIAGTYVAAANRCGIHFGTPASIIPTDGAGTLTDNACSLGVGSYRWSVVYAGTGTINTSDEKLKQDIESLEQAELNVAATIKGLIKKFRFIDAVVDKSADARIHVGVIAQEVEQAFTDEGLDPRRYALFCEDMLEDGSKRLGIRYDELLAFVIAAL